MNEDDEEPFVYFGSMAYHIGFFPKKSLGGKKLANIVPLLFSSIEKSFVNIFQKLKQLQNDKPQLTHGKIKVQFLQIFVDTYLH